MINLPTLKQLRYLVALRDHGHFGRAAAAVYVTQSTLSAAIAELEAVLGAALVDRTRRRVLFTPVGEAVVADARPILLAVTELARAAAASGAPLSGPLRMGVIPTISPFLLPRALPALRDRFAKLKLYLREELSARLIAQLHRGDLDIVLLALPYDCGNVESMTLFQDRFSLVCRADDPLGDASRVTPETLSPDSLLLLEDGHCLRDHALSACARVPRAHRAPVEATSLFTLVQMVDNGLGVTLLPQLALNAGILKGTALTAIPFAGDHPYREIGLVWRSGDRRREEFRTLGYALAELAPKTPDATS